MMDTIVPTVDDKRSGDLLLLTMTRVLRQYGAIIVLEPNGERPCKHTTHVLRIQKNAGMPVAGPVSLAGRAGFRESPGPATRERMN